MNAERNDRDMALRRAVRGIEEGRRACLPSGFARQTMRRIEAVKQRQAHRRRIALLVSAVAVVVVGIAVVAVFCGDSIVSGLVGAFRQGPSSSWIVPMVVCLVFFAVFDTLLRRRFRPGGGIG